MKKRILQINSADNWAGGEVYTHLVCSQLEKRGFSVTLACRPSSVIGKVFKQEGKKIIQLPLAGAADLKSAYALAKYCRQEKIEVLHSHLGRDYWLAAETKLFYPAVKVVFTRHVLIPAKKSWGHRWMFSQAERIIAVSEAVRQAFLQTAPVSAEKVITIHNGIDTKKFSQAIPGKLRQELNLADDVPLIGMVGHVSPHKGQEVFLQSIPAVLQQCPQAHFVIVGSDFKGGEYSETLQNTARQMNIAENVHFLGERNDIPQVMTDLNIFVLASKEEPFGLVVTEAMAGQAAVIATEAGGVKEIIETERDGLLIPYGQPETLAQEIVRLIQNPALRRSLTTTALTKVQKTFSVESMMDKVVTLYQNL